MLKWQWNAIMRINGLLDKRLTTQYSTALKADHLPADSGSFVMTVLGPFRFFSPQGRHEAPRHRVEACLAVVKVCS